MITKMYFDKYVLCKDVPQPRPLAAQEQLKNFSNKNGQRHVGLNLHYFSKNIREKRRSYKENRRLPKPIAVK